MGPDAKHGQLKNVSTGDHKEDLGFRKKKLKETSSQLFLTTGGDKVRAGIGDLDGGHRSNSGSAEYIRGKVGSDSMEE